MVECSQCGGNGWYSVERPDGRGGYVSALARCEHGRNGAAPAGGFTPISSLTHQLIESLENAALTPNDKRIAALVRTHIGQANALRIREICEEMWPEEMADPKQFDRLARAVKESVERLRTFARLPIAATKVPPYGYFIPQTAEEWDAAFDRYVQEGIKSFLLARLFKPQADLVQALRGQLELGTCDSGLTTQADPNPETRTPIPESRQSEAR